MQILLIEDDPMIGESLSYGLKKSGFSVDWIPDGELGDESLRVKTYSLVLLDLGLPGKSGLDVLQSLRARKDKTPVIILTARDAVADRVAGLNMGADDYLIKPCALEEIEARINAVSRRHVGQAESILESAELTLNTVTKEIQYGEKRLLLSAKEYALMYALIKSPGRIFSRPELEEELYGWNEEVSSNAIEFHISQLRKKLGSTVIRNVRGLGYKVLKEPEEPA